jgi:hypothetical protein
VECSASQSERERVSGWQEAGCVLELHGLSAAIANMFEQGLMVSPAPREDLEGSKAWLATLTAVSDWSGRWKMEDDEKERECEMAFWAPILPPLRRPAV